MECPRKVVQHSPEIPQIPRKFCDHPTYLLDKIPKKYYKFLGKSFIDQAKSWNFLGNLSNILQKSHKFLGNFAIIQPTNLTRSPKILQIPRKILH